MTNPDFIPIEEVAKSLSISTQRVYQLAQAKKLPHIRMGRALRFPREAWNEWLKDMTTEAFCNYEHPEFERMRNERK